ncbi:MAG: hypothetical protein QOH71_4395 [Blastocatellia bacterium]|jgi:hypothetical protein|nr:hypothetical protein [Blastocatellia bacterium]
MVVHFRVISWIVFVGTANTKPTKANLPSHLPWDWAFLEISVDMNSVDR